MNTDGVLYTRKESLFSAVSRVAAFDLDDTLIRTKSGKKFAISDDDWQPFCPEVLSTLRSLQASNYQIALLTNQLGISKGKQSAQSFMNKLNTIITEWSIPIVVIAATVENHFRKPSIGMWTMLADLMSKHGSTDLDLLKCFYVGDAAGREGDFSCSDRKFAANVGIAFQTPEEFFLQHAPAPFNWGATPAELLPMSVPTDDFAAVSVAAESQETAVYRSQSQEVIVMVGMPASGKSTFVRKHLLPHGYVHVNRDTLVTQEKCLQGARQALTQGKSVVIDNTNPQAARRSEWIALARQFNVPARCFQMQTSEEMAKHLNIFRERKGETSRVPPIAYATFKKAFQQPTISEGFSEVRYIDNKVTSFASPEEEAVFRQLS